MDKLRQYAHANLENLRSSLRAVEARHVPTTAERMTDTMRAALRHARPWASARRRALGTFALGEDHAAIRDVARAFAEERLFPVAGDVDKRHAFPPPLPTRSSSVRY